MLDLLQHKTFIIFSSIGLAFDTKISIFVELNDDKMGRKEKLVRRFMELPKDFTFEETIALLAIFGYHVHNKGATSGSRIRFKNADTDAYIDIHRPHLGSIMKEWMMKAIYQHLKNKGVI